MWTLEADTYILAAGARSNADALPVLREKFGEVQPIGDAREPRRIIDAMHEGFDAGLSI